MATFRFFFLKLAAIHTVETDDRSHVQSLEDYFYHSKNKAYVFEIIGGKAFSGGVEIGPNWQTYRDFQAWCEAGGFERLSERLGDLEP